MNLTKNELILIDSLICDFLYQQDELKDKITNEGIVKLLKLRLKASNEILNLPRFSKEIFESALKEVKIKGN